MKRCHLLSLAAILSFCVVASTRADEPRNLPPQKDTLQAVLDRIKQHAAGDAWKQPGFKDDAIEAWLDKLVASIAKATERPELKLPLRLKDVAPGQPQAQARGPSRLRGALVVGDNIDLKGSYVHNSILLANGNVDVLGTNDSIIIAGGVVTVHANSGQSVIVAGALIDAKTDGIGFGPKPGGGSVLISRGWAQFGEGAFGTIVAAPEGITLSKNLRSADVRFVNSPLPLPPADNLDKVLDVKSVRVPDLPLERLRMHPLADKLSVRGVVYGETTATTAFGGTRAAMGPTSLLLQFEGQRYIADRRQAILDEAGAPVAALRDWQLACITSSLAVLTSPDSVVVLRTDTKK